MRSWFFLLAVLRFATPAWATPEPLPRTKRLLMRAERWYWLSDYEKSNETLRQAFLESKYFLLLPNIGSNYEDLAEREQDPIKKREAKRAALEQYEKFVAARPNARKTPEILTRIGRLKQEIAALDAQRQAEASLQRALAEAKGREEAERALRLEAEAELKSMNSRLAALERRLEQTRLVTEASDEAVGRARLGWGVPLVIGGTGGTVAGIVLLVRSAGQLDAGGASGDPSSLQLANLGGGLLLGLGSAAATTGTVVLWSASGGRRTRTVWLRPGLQAVTVAGLF